MDETQYINALIELHSGVDRQGPGDSCFSEFILEQLPDLPPKPRIADIGCGAGAGVLILAKKYQTKVKAVDFAKKFLDQLVANANQEGLAHLIEPIESDMGNLDWPKGSIDLLWSEGAAYNITFEGALKAWRPLLAANGIAAISEMSYFSDPPPEVVKQYMKNAYPDIKTETENIELINANGYELLATHRLPTQAWWENYYDPLRENIQLHKNSNDPVMRAVIEETEEEMNFFKEHSDDYGYTFYLIRAT